MSETTTPGLWSFDPSDEPGLWVPIEWARPQSPMAEAANVSTSPQ